MDFRISLIPLGKISDFAAYIPLGVRDIIERSRANAAILGAYADEMPCGVLAAAHDEGGIALLQFYVAKELRGLGLGSALFNAFIDSLPDKTANDRLHGLFTPETPIGQAGFASDPGCRFLKERGFEIEAEGGGLYKTRLGDICAGPLAKVSAAPGGEARFIPLSGLPDYLLKDFNRKTETELGLSAAPYPKAGVLPEISHACVVDGGVVAVAVVAACGAEIELPWLYCRPKAHPMLAPLLRSVCDAAAKSCPPETEVRISAVNSASVNLVAKLCPNAIFNGMLRAEGSISANRLRARTNVGIGRLTLLNDSVAEWTESILEV